MNGTKYQKWNLGLQVLPADLLVAGEPRAHHEEGEEVDGGGEGGVQDPGAPQEQQDEPLPRPEEDLGPLLPPPPDRLLADVPFLGLRLVGSLLSFLELFAGYVDAHRRKDHQEVQSYQTDGVHRFDAVQPVEAEQGEQSTLPITVIENRPIVSDG